MSSWFCFVKYLQTAVGKMSEFYILNFAHESCLYLFSQLRSIEGSLGHCLRENEQHDAIPPEKKRQHALLLVIHPEEFSVFRC